jgi:hypothetical protein
MVSGPISDKLTAETTICGFPVVRMAVLGAQHRTFEAKPQRLPATSPTIEPREAVKPGI